MRETYKLSDFQQAFWSQRHEISYNDIAVVPERDSDGNLIPVETKRIKLTRAETGRLIQSYFSVRFMDQFRAVVPLAIYLALFQILILEQLSTTRG